MAAAYGRRELLGRVDQDQEPKIFAGGGPGRAVQSDQDGVEIACGDFEKLSVID